VRLWLSLAADVVTARVIASSRSTERSGLGRRGRSEAPDRPYFWASRRSANCLNSRSSGSQSGSTGAAITLRRVSRASASLSSANSVSARNHNEAVLFGS